MWPLPVRIVVAGVMVAIALLTAAAIYASVAGSAVTLARAVGWWALLLLVWPGLVAFGAWRLS